MPPTTTPKATEEEIEQLKAKHDAYRAAFARWRSGEGSIDNSLRLRMELEAAAVLLLPALLARLDEQRRVIDKLPRYADTRGPITPGDLGWTMADDGDVVEQVTVYRIEEDRELVFVRSMDGYHWCQCDSRCYSTEAAALASPPTPAGEEK